MLASMKGRVQPAPRSRACVAARRASWDTVRETSINRTGSRRRRRSGLCARRARRSRRSRRAATHVVRLPQPVPHHVAGNEDEGLTALLHARGLSGTWAVA